MILINIYYCYCNKRNRYSNMTTSAANANVNANVNDNANNAESWALIESYFKDKHLKQLVKHQIESYNQFVNFEIENTINMFNPLNVISEQFYNREHRVNTLEVNITFENLKLHRPQHHENNGSTKVMFPQDARLRNFTYASNMLFDLNIEYTIRSGEKLDNVRKVAKSIPNIHIGKMPIMLKSTLCVLTKYVHLPADITGECRLDPGGYFIINGSEKTCIGQERAAENQVYCFRTVKSTKWDWSAEYKAIPDWKHISPKQLYIMISSKNNGFGRGIYLEIPRLKNPIPIFIVFRAFGITSDRDICEKIVIHGLHIKEKEANREANMNMDDRTGKILAALQASIVDANEHLTYEDSIKYIINNVIYTPINNTDKETGYKKKQDFAMEVLKNDLFPNAYNETQKIHMLGYMVNRLIMTSFGWLKPSDRDNYYNKRIDLTGSLINNLFRNYFNKLVKDMQKQIIKEMNTGSWRATEDYENIINLTNIYKIVKSTTIENGIKRALSTGDFGIKHINNNKVGVAQVLNRLTYVASLSHLRRINTPIDKSGKLIPPRRLHNSSWGFVCPAESPEGSSIGVVKNMSYMCHITIPCNSTPLYGYIEPMIRVLTECSIAEMSSASGNVRVFINGLWVGMSLAGEASGLYLTLKKMKQQGKINIYTSIMFDYANQEIRVRSDAGRMCRPVLRVENNQSFLTPDIVRRLDSGDLSWDDLCLSMKIDEPIIEYIDSYEQNTAMIAMKLSELANTNTSGGEEHLIYNYTHCEIHPSTILGILASCIPFPEHNQAPRVTYQSAMGKQAMGVYVTNYENRMDKTAYVLSYPMRPLVETRFMNIIQLNEIPSGEMVIVAIMSNTGYNQEDSILFNKGSIDRGLFQAVVYHTEKDEDKKLYGEEEIRGPPDRMKTKSMKFANYDKINDRGVMDENALVEDRDVIIAKAFPIKENRNDFTKVIKFEDDSRIYRTNEETYIDRNVIDKNGDGYNFCKVRVRTTRKPVIGDKFSCYTPDHDVLTDAGWINIVDLTMRHRVACLVNGNTLEYHCPKKVMNYDCDDEIYEIDSDQISLSVTKNHRMWVGSNNNGENYTIKTAEECYGKQWTYMKHVDNWCPDFEKCPDNILKQFRLNSEKTEATHFIMYDDDDDDRNIAYELDITAWIKFFGIWMATEGCVNIDAIDNKHYIDIAAANNDDRVESVLDELAETLHCKWRKTTDGKYRLHNEHIVNYMLSLSADYTNKTLPEWCWYLSKSQSELLLLSMELGNGNNTSSTRLADDYQRLCLHAGFSGNIYSKCGHERLSLTRVSSQITNTNTNTNTNIDDKTGAKRNDRYIHYTGKVYCCEVPTNNGVIYVRKNGKSCWCGNSRHGQKGTIGNIIPEEDMPFTGDGMKPDIIINPHAIPSRMTIGQLKETLLGKVLLELGLFGDGTSFNGEFEIKDICKKLQGIGFESNGNEILHNGLTGEQLESNIFIGPAFYQRLKHMVKDKQHSRSIGPMVNLTRQPAEGRSKDGGLRFGEMERDCMIAHGASRFTKGRLYDESDKFSVHVCNKCGMIGKYNEKHHIHMCGTCDNRTDFKYVEIPYACKLLFQELISMNVAPRIIAE